MDTIHQAYFHTDMGPVWSVQTHTTRTLYSSMVYECGLAMQDLCSAVTAADEPMFAKF